MERDIESDGSRILRLKEGRLTWTLWLAMALSWTLGCSLLAMAAASGLWVGSLYSTTDCSGTPYVEQKFVQNTCMARGSAGDYDYVTYTCNSTHAVSSWYTDAACTTYRDSGPGFPVTTADVGVCTDVFARSMKITCEAGKFATAGKYSDSACTTKESDYPVMVECFASGTLSSGTVTEASQKTRLGDILTHTTYSSSDCTGDATTTSTLGSCGNCTLVPGLGYLMWDCTSETGLASPMKLHLVMGMIGFVFHQFFWEINLWKPFGRVLPGDELHTVNHSAIRYMSFGNVQQGPP